MKTKLEAKNTILSAIKRYPMDLDELKEYFNERNKEISKHTLTVWILRLINDGLAVKDGDKILYSDPIMQNREIILKELEGKSLEEVKNLVVVYKSYFSLVKNSKIVKNKLSLVI